jgi:putative Holliday junction resolvase
MRVLAVDPGEKRIGLAISDPTGTISRPLDIIEHQSRIMDAERIIVIAQEHGVQLIVVGWPLNAEGEVGHSARKSMRLADVIREKCDTRVEMWDESGTTQEAIQSRISMGVSRKNRSGHLDDVAASILLQDFLIQNESLVRNTKDDHG